VLVGWWFMRLLDVLHRLPLPAFQFGPDVFGMRAQRFAAHLHASQFVKQRGCHTEGGDGTHCRLPVCQSRARLLIRCQPQRLVRWLQPRPHRQQ